MSPDEVEERWPSERPRWVLLLHEQHPVEGLGAVPPRSYAVAAEILPRPGADQARRLGGRQEGLVGVRMPRPIEEIRRDLRMQTAAVTRAAVALDLGLLARGLASATDRLRRARENLEKGIVPFVSVTTSRISPEEENTRQVQGLMGFLADLITRARRMVEERGCEGEEALGTLIAAGENETDAAREALGLRRRREIRLPPIREAVVDVLDDVHEELVALWARMQSAGGLWGGTPGVPTLLDSLASEVTTILRKWDRLEEAPREVFR